MRCRKISLFWFMGFNKYCIALILLFFGVAIAHSQEKRTEICIDFRVNSASIDLKYSDNAANVQKLLDLLGDLRYDSEVNIVGVAFSGMVSPEGSDQFNRKLARERLSILEEIVRNKLAIPDSLITRNDAYIPWDYLKSKVADSELTHKNEIMSILDEEPQLVENTIVDNRIVKLRALDEGRVWYQIHQLFFERMRRASVVFVTYKKDLMPTNGSIVAPVAIDTDAKPVDEAHDTAAIIEPTKPKVGEWSRKLHVKTNVIGLGMSVANAAIEVDLAKHLSLSLPVYYSAWNYFKTTTKFRVLAVQPEFRYWFRRDNQRFFIGAHFGYAQYNLAIDRDYRYQDHNGKSPAMGGGISIGYRLPISRSHNWNLEFTVGAGVYDLHYDRFYNVENGRLVDTSRKTYWGIDNAAINISYRFDLKKRNK